MEASVTIHMTPEDLEQLIERVVTRVVSREPERLYTAKEAKKLLGIVDHTTFLAMGLQPKLRGKRKLYSLKNA